MRYHEGPTLIAVVTDAGLLPKNERRPEKGGWIALNWETKPGGMALENDSGDKTGIKAATLLVSMERALQAMSALARGELIC